MNNPSALKAKINTPPKATRYKRNSLWVGNSTNIEAMQATINVASAIVPRNAPSSHPHTVAMKSNANQPAAIKVLPFS